MIDFLGNHRFYISVVLSLIWPIIILFLLYRKNKREQGSKQTKTPEQKKKDHKLFASVGKGDDQSDKGWPLGYIGFDTKASTDEIIDRFIDKG